MTHICSSFKENKLRKELLRLSLKLRNTRKAKNRSIPRFISYDFIRRADNQVIGRKKVILMSSGCSVATCTMCPFTNENNYGVSNDPNSHDFVTQVTKVLSRTSNEPNYEVLALYNDGSFFATREIPTDIQIKIAKLVAQAGVHRLIVESLPQFITPKTLEPFIGALNGVELEIGIGFQSSDDFVRETLINTQISRPEFERALSIMAEFGVHAKIYLMVKPPFLTDLEAITDVVQSAEYLLTLGIQGVTLCPTQVSRNTVAWELWGSGYYQPPNLWTVVDTVRSVHNIFQIRVACINLRSSDFESVFSSSCPDCADKIVDGLLRYNETGNLDCLPDNCCCRPKNKPVKLDRQDIISRSLSVLEKLNHI